MLTECTSDQVVARLGYLFTEGLERCAAGIRKLAEKMLASFYIQSTTFAS
jgi:hypothetical protein